MKMNTPLRKMRRLWRAMQPHHAVAVWTRPSLTGGFTGLFEFTSNGVRVATGQVWGATSDEAMNSAYSKVIRNPEVRAELKLDEVPD